MWGALGYGRGALTLRGTVYASEHTELALKSDALWVRTSSEDAPGMRAVDNADTSRIRLLLSGRHQRALANDALLTPSFELEQRLSLSLAGERRETALARPEHGLMLRTSMPW